MTISQLPSSGVEVQMHTEHVIVMVEQTRLDISYQRATELHEQLRDVRLASMGLEAHNITSDHIEEGDLLFGSQVVTLERYTDGSTHVRLANSVYAHMRRGTDVTVQRRIK
jgi:hypothetical protein